MSVLARLGSVVLLLAAVAPAVIATNCKSSEFWWETKSCCLPHGGPPSPPPPPAGNGCPSQGWYWHTEQKCCVPHNPSPPAPTCAAGWTWNDSKCTPPVPRSPPSNGNNCKNTEFWWDDKSCCLPHGGPPSPPSPPPGNGCPSNGWYWHGDKGCCVPQHPSPPAPTCPSGWSWSNSKCTPPPPPPPPSNPNNCKNTEFWWDTNKCCLPHGGPPSPPPPSGGNDCPPSGWYWHSQKGCCVPQHPSPPPPSCKPGWKWDNNKCCPPSPPSPQPSHHAKRNNKSRSTSLCPKGLSACPIPGVMNTSDYECLDTTSELESCGGCVSLGKGQDCTAIKGAWNVGCERGSCKVFSCAAGYKRSSDGNSCVSN